MDISKLLEEFDDLYMVCDPVEAKVLELYPPMEGVQLPCDILSIFSIKRLNLDINHVKKIEHFLKSSLPPDCMNIQGPKGWYGLELKNVGPQKQLLHFFNLENSMAKMNKLIAQSQLDPLTNALQKTAIESYVDSVIKDKPDKQATMFMMDVDYFKNINDNYGHLFGDNVIVAVANALKGLCGASGKVGRIVGDEFILFVEHDLDRLGMKNIARLIRYVLDNLEIEGKPFSCTATIGISQYPKDGKTFQELYTACDKALYRGKEKGRDCHIIYDPQVHLGATATLENAENAAVVNKLSITAFIGLILKKCLGNVKTNRREIYTDVADFFNLDRIVLFRNGKVDLKYTKHPEDSNVALYKKFPFDSYKKNFITDELHYINDTSTWQMKDMNVYGIYEKCSTISVVQVLTVDNDGQVDGFMSYEMVHTHRVWQRGELNAFSIITKIINILSNYKKIS